MTRILLFSLGLLIFVLLEISFISALSPILRLAPLTFAAGVTLLQHHGVKEGVWLLVGYGIVLDLFAIGNVAPASIGFFIAAFAAYWFAQRVFSNRSYYGLIGCGLTVYVILLITQGATLLFRNIAFSEPAHVFRFLTEAGQSTLWLLGLLTVFFIFGGRIQRMLSSTFIIPRERRTLS